MVWYAPSALGNNNLDPLPGGLWGDPNAKPIDLDTSIPGGLWGDNTKKSTPTASNKDPLPVPDDVYGYKKPETAVTPKPLEVINQPTLEDYIREAQKLSDQKVKAQQLALNQNTGDIASQFASKLYGQNVGATSGVGKELVNRAIAEQAQRLEPYAMQQAAELGTKELDYRQNQQDTQRQVLFNGVLDGTIDKAALTAADWASFGITDPNVINTFAQRDINNDMLSQGLDPKDPAARSAYQAKLKTAAVDNLKKQIIGEYSKTHDGKVPNSAEMEMLLAIYGEGTGALSTAEMDAIIKKYNEQQWIETMQKANAMNPPQNKNLTFLCTVLYEKGKLPDSVYIFDALAGEYYRQNDFNVYLGYSIWAEPLAQKMRKSRLIEWLLTPFIKAWAYQMAGKHNLVGKLLQVIGVPICRAIGSLNSYGMLREVG